MLEIKFKAWDKKIQQFIDAKEIVINDGKVFRNWQNFEDYEPDDGTIELLWFTGLEDKNGSEIYESDLIRYVGRAGSDLYEIIFIDGCFITKCITTPGDWNNDPMAANALDFKENWKVIGNRYENSELIDKSQ